MLRIRLRIGAIVSIKESEYVSGRIITNKKTNKKTPRFFSESLFFLSLATDCILINFSTLSQIK